jgi:hypothetical protein
VHSPSPGIVLLLMWAPFPVSVDLKICCAWSHRLAKLLQKEGASRGLEGQIHGNSGAAAGSLVRSLHARLLCQREWIDSFARIKGGPDRGHHRALPAQRGQLADPEDGLDPGAVRAEQVAQLGRAQPGSRPGQG